MPASFIIKQFAATGSSILQDHSTRLTTPDNLLTLVDMSNSVIKPGDCYLVTISKIGAEQIIIEGDTHVEKETKTEETRENQENSATDSVSGDWSKKS